MRLSRPPLSLVDQPPTTRHEWILGIVCVQVGQDLCRQGSRPDPAGLQAARLARPAWQPEAHRLVLGTRRPLVPRSRHLLVPGTATSSPYPQRRRWTAPAARPRPSRQRRLVLVRPSRSSCGRRQGRLRRHGPAREGGLLRPPRRVLLDSAPVRQPLPGRRRACSRSPGAGTAGRISTDARAACVPGRARDGRRAVRIRGRAGRGLVVRRGRAHHRARDRERRLDEGRAQRAQGHLPERVRPNAGLSGDTFSLRSLALTPPLRAPPFLSSSLAVPFLAPCTVALSSCPSSRAEGCRSSAVPQ